MVWDVAVVKRWCDVSDGVYVPCIVFGVSTHPQRTSLVFAWRPISVRFGTKPECTDGEVFILIYLSHPDVYVAFIVNECELRFK